MDMSFQILMIT